MTKIQEKWRESINNINDINFKKIKFKKIISYPPAGNDVFECIGEYNDREINFVFKSERGTFANFSNEIDVLPKVSKYFPVPKIIETGKSNNHIFIVMQKINGEKLSDIFKENPEVNQNDYLYEYGKALAKIHKTNIECGKAKIRNINDYPKKETYSKFDEWELKIVNYLKNEKPKKIDYNTFIHGDFHYGNILWNKNKIVAILDWEYSGIGFKEQDIAWALLLRPGQQFMDIEENIKSFLQGYISINNYDEKKLKWCYINGLLHFYLMNKKNNDIKYLKKLKLIINKIVDGEYDKG